MNYQVPFLCFATFFTITACKEEGFNVPQGTPESNSNNQPANDCPETWSEVGGVWLDPNLCGAWSAKSDLLNWQQADALCEEYDGSDLPGWRMATLEELRAMSTKYHPLEDVMGDLWTSTEDTATGLMWTVNLEQPGMEVLLDPDDFANVRCFTSFR